MSDSTGTSAIRLSVALADRYHLEHELGQGGMATVYLAEDLKHKRKVALKVLKPELAAVLGAERFVQEITTTAALQHPHILPLFDSGTADGFLYYVMPFIQGETLRSKLDRETQLGVDEAVGIAIAVADALDYAHRQGVIHRDIKPENILLHEGRPMVADFGIALAVSAAAGGRMTETGLSLGTPHYMSPEQATAEKEISGRSDVYSLASVLYEMLAGQPPHLGGSAQQIIMKIIAESAEPVTRYRKSVPPNVAAAVARALEKLPADRFDSARGFAEALRNPGFTVASTAAAAAFTGSGWRARAAIPLGVAALLLLVAAIWGWWRPEPAPRVMRLDLTTGQLTPIFSSDVVVSPDGSTLAVGASEGGEAAIYVRRLDGDPEFRKLPGTESVVGSPAFSPDSRWIAFRRNSDGALVKMAVSGGGATTLVQLGTATGSFLHWGTDDQIVYSGGPPGLYRVSASGGTPEHLVKTQGAARYSFLLPDGSGVLFSGPSGVWVYSFASDSVAPLVGSGVHPTYVETGHLLYVADGGGLFAAPFDLGSHQVTGQGVRVLDRVAAGVGQRGYSVSRNGVLVQHEGVSTISGGSGTQTRLLLVTPGGAVDTLRLLPGRRLNPRFAPDGRSIAFELQVPGREGSTDIHTFDLGTGTNTQLTFESDNDDPVWSPDGTQILFTRSVAPGDEDLFVKPADNSGTEQSVLAAPGNQNPMQWLDNDTIAFRSNAAGQWDLQTLSLQGDGAPTAYLEAPWGETDLQVSPDRQLAVFASDETRPADIWLRDFPVAQGKWRVSTGGGSAPRWSPDGLYIYYWTVAPVDSLLRVRVDRTPAVVVRAPELVLTMNIAGVANWDLHPDGRRLIVTVDDVAPQVVAAGADQASNSRYLLVLNWFTELRARMRP